MTTEVSDDDFQEILAQTRHFVRTAVVPASRRFWPRTGFPTICASRPRRWACSVTRSRRSGAGWG